LECLEYARFNLSSFRFPPPMNAHHSPVHTHVIECISGGGAVVAQLCDRVLPDTTELAERGRAVQCSRVGQASAAPRPLCGAPRPRARRRQAGEPHDRHDRGPASRARPLARPVRRLVFVRTRIWIYFFGLVGTSFEFGSRLWWFSNAFSSKPENVFLHCRAFARFVICRRPSAPADEDRVLVRFSSR
jgi:hypothetical protein